ncbi:MAG: VOC family protein [Betaproteobacteria bacterium]
MPEKTKFRLRKLVPNLGVSDLRRSLAFYREFFGFTVLDSWENDAGEVVWCWLRSGVTELMLQQLAPEQQITLEPALGQSWMLYLRPHDIDEIRQVLLRAEIAVSEIQTTAYGARECFLADPDGYDLWLSVPERGLGGDDDEDDDYGTDGSHSQGLPDELLDGDDPPIGDSRRRTH